MVFIISWVSTLVSLFQLSSWFSFNWESILLTATISSDPVTESTPEPAPDTVAEDVPESLPTEESKAEQTLELLQTVETETESVIVPEQKRRKKISWGKMLLVLLIAFVILVVAYMTVGRLCPEWIDQFLYTPEELEILNR